MPDATCINVEKLNFDYDSSSVLTNVTFTINVGEYVGIVGPNGGGKTTLVKLLLGLLMPESGSIHIFNTPLKEFQERHYLGYVSQRIAQTDFPATVWEVVKSGRSAKCAENHICLADETSEINSALTITGIAHLKSRRLGELSGGERQRVFIARALAGHPRILILDEPTTGVDSATQEQFYELLEKLNREHQLTILFVSHDVGVITRYASKILYVNHTVTVHENPKETLPHDLSHTHH